MMPIISSNPDFRCIYTTTPPPDDNHPSFDLLSPPADAVLPVNPKGNWYRSELGVWVLRVTAEDAYADGVPLYDDDTGAPISPAESRARAHDKDAWDRNYGCKFVMGGTSAVSLQLLDTAQRRGVGRCACIQVDSDLDLERALGWIQEKLTPADPVACGWDLATTTKDTSNPSAFAVVQRIGAELVAVAVVLWKTADPDVATDRVRRILEAIARRRAGQRARRLGVDATNERYFATKLRRELAAEVPVDLVIGSETVEIPGQEQMTVKQFLGGQLVGELEDNHLTLPPERYLREDFRLVRKDRGWFVCEPDANGRHGDTFDAIKIAVDKLLGRGPSAMRFVTSVDADRRDGILVDRAAGRRAVI
ncbi:MAG: hypothetical protein ACYDC1_10820 [Limisphaerales bacterium]